MLKRDLPAVEQIITQHDGTLQPGINWTWAYFESDVNGQACFELVKGQIEHRGYYKAQPNSDNPNLRKGGFRFR